MKAPKIIGEDGITRIWVQNARQEKIRPINGHALAVVTEELTTPFYQNAIAGRPAGRQDYTAQDLKEIAAEGGNIHAIPSSAFLKQRGYVGIYVPEDQLPANEL